MSINHTATPSEFSTVIAPESICAAIEHRAQAAPDSVALTLSGRSMTYRELNWRANRLADQLCLQGVGPEIPVGLVCGRGFESIVGMLAILKADGVCVHFDATLPAERLRRMIALAGLRLVVTTEAMHADRSGLDGPVAFVRLCRECPPAPNLQSRLRPANTSHIHFSTTNSGRPLAVAVTHAATENLIRWQQQEIPFRPGMRVLQFSPPGLDSAWQEIAGTLAAGGLLVIPTAEKQSSIVKLARLLADEKIERAFLPAATLAHLADTVLADASTLDALRDIIVTCGPVLISQEIRAFFTAHPKCRLHAHYGHAECLVALAYTIEGTPATWPNILPLGRPIKGVVSHLLDSDQQPVAPGETGELWIGGAYLPCGYHRDPAANRLRFLSDPQAVEGSSFRIFRTGDRARLNTDGLLELVGTAPPPAPRGKKNFPPSCNRNAERSLRSSNRNARIVA